MDCHLIEVLRHKVRIYRLNRQCRPERRSLTGKELEEISLEMNGIVNRIVSEIHDFKYEDIDATPTKKINEYRILSYNGDLLGKVLEIDNQICRGIYQERVEGVMKLWRTGLLQTLGKYHLIPETTLTDYYMEEYPLILKHEKVDMSVSSLWNDDMICDAAILISLIKRIANHVGYTLHDGHLNNVSFHNGRPVFTDIGSIVEDRGQITVCDREILFTACYRLVSSKLHNSILKHFQLYDETNNVVWIAPRYYNDFVREYQALIRAFKRYHMLHSSFSYTKLIYRMFDCYEMKPEYIKAVFQNQNTYTYFIEEHTKKDIAHIIALLTDLQADISSATDIGGTEGHLPMELYKALHCHVHALEYTMIGAQKTYNRFKSCNIPINTYLFNYLYGASEEKLDTVKADLVIALDITCNCAGYQRYRVDSLINDLKKISNQYVAVTYYPYKKEDNRYIPFLDENGKESVEVFERIFAQSFSVICRREVVDNCLEKKHYIYIGKCINE